MKRAFLTTGLILSLAINLVAMQDKSVAGSDASASKLGIASVAMLNTKPETATQVESDQHREEHREHSHSITIEDVEPNRDTKAVSPRRRVVTKAAASELMEIERPMVAAIDESDATMAHKELFNEVLYALPTECRNTLQYLYVKYEKQEHRGLAGKSIMILDGTVKSAAELRALFVHESGHNWDLGCLKGTSDAGKSAFSDGDEAVYKNDPSINFYRISWITSSVQRSNTNPEDFVSGYASYDVYEDFAESFAYFILHNEEFAARATTNDALAKKYIYIRDTLFGGQIPTIATSNEDFDGRVPWDITKLSYNWHPSTTTVQR